MDDINKTLTRGVEQILPDTEGLKKLMESRKITLYQGFDPTNKSLHIGNFIGLRKLAQFQKLGHKVIFLIGDFTGMIGDPTDKKATRQRLTKNEVQDNLASFKDQASSVLSFDGENAAEVRFNSEWLSKLNFEDIVDLASNFTVQQMIERSMYAERLKNKKPIYLHEFFYPLMQGYDSVAMDVDLEIGGNDQLFNMLAGRALMKSLKGKEKYVLTTKLLVDSQGLKMGKTTGNAIFMDNTPTDIYGKMMAITDDMIELGVELLTDLGNVDLTNPMEAKKQLAYEVVKQIKGEEEAKESAEHFQNTFQNNNVDYSNEIEYTEYLADAVANVIGSKSEAKRLIEQKAVDVNDAVVDNPIYKLEGGEKIKIGKKNFVKIRRP